MQAQITITVTVNRVGDWRQARLIAESLALQVQELNIDTAAYIDKVDVSTVKVED